MSLTNLIDTTANLEFGILIAVVLVVLMVAIVASLNNRQKLSPLSYIIALVLIVPLTFQMSRLIGACNINDTSSTVSDIVSIFSPTLGHAVEEFTTKDIGWFICRRVLWSVLFLCIGGVGVYITMDKNTRRHGGRPDGAQIGRRYTSVKTRRR